MRKHMPLGASVIAAVALLVTAGPAFAPHVAQMQVNPGTAKPGQEVSVFGPRGYGKTNPVEVRWDAVDGPVLGTFQPNSEGFAMWGPGTITIPADAKPGNHTLFVTQKLEKDESHIRGVPVRTVIQVSDANGAVPVVGEQGNQVVPRTATLQEDEPVSAGALALVALGAAGVAMFVAGMAALAAGRRSPEQTPERVSAR
ncbi:MAG: hypothetical protein ABR540_06430 [Acidimicrobiales bacterium]|nr:hypothetical protein [Actinomycetota bacterium]